MEKTFRGCFWLHVVSYIFILVFHSSLGKNVSWRFLFNQTQSHTLSLGKFNSNICRWTHPTRHLEWRVQWAKSIGESIHLYITSPSLRGAKGIPQIPRCQDEQTSCSDFLHEPSVSETLIFVYKTKTPFLYTRQRPLHPSTQTPWVTPAVNHLHRDTQYSGSRKHLRSLSNNYKFQVNSQ